MQRCLADWLRKKEKRINESEQEIALRLSRERIINNTQSASEGEMDRLARLEKLTL